ncbi:hypothetical protein EYF80_012388 [Liparis tanakae]|uniref:Uncharacterized protein n=1 Tax=Liparis tanakae TaxID=230148 RepID=A0A4Z2IJ09_9TELE|nr:hypothetical protein EYF80_012388 [Liparis tanakae]
MIHSQTRGMQPLLLLNMCCNTADPRNDFCVCRATQTLRRVPVNLRAPPRHAVKRSRAERRGEEKRREEKRGEESRGEERRGEKGEEFATVSYDKKSVPMCHAIVSGDADLIPFSVIDRGENNHSS